MDSLPEVAGRFQQWGSSIAVFDEAKGGRGIPRFIVPGMSSESPRQAKRYVDRRNRQYDNPPSPDPKRLRHRFDYKIDRWVVSVKTVVVMSAAKPALASVLERVKRELAEHDVIVYRHAKATRSDKMKFINLVKAERELLLSHVEAEQLINALEATVCIPGDVAEAGTYRGASARLLRHYTTPDKLLHLFDTFSGLPQPGERDADFQPGQFASSLDEVQQYLGTSGIQYHVGVFPQSVDDKTRAIQFSFVHLDLDLYEGTLESLRFFYPRMNSGGILVSHDFGAARAPGVLQAFHDYFSPMRVPFVQLSGYQGLVVKLSTDTAASLAPNPI